MLNIGEFARLGQVSPRMLRHYDELGLLKPDRVDPASNYRFYTARQLGRLHRIVALRDLGFTLDQIRPMLDDDPSVEQLLPEVIAHLHSAGVPRGISAAYYEDDGGTAEDGNIVLHAGFEIGDHDVPESESVRAVDLPVVEVASVVHRGTVESIPLGWEALVRWIEDSGYHLVGDCRELYHEWHEEDPTRHVTELQQPISR